MNMVLEWRDLLRWILLILFFVGGIIFGRNKNDDSTSNIVIARVGDRVITLNDFIERSEYTIRPPYCRGNTNIDKKIILNSLLAEKVFSLESDHNSVMQDPRFSNLIIGRQEQKMRELLYYSEGTTKVKPDTGELKKAFSVAGRTYKIQYFNIADQNKAKELYKNFKGTDSSFRQIYKSFSGADSIPEREVNWSSPETKIIHKALFSDKLQKNQLLEPLKINDSTNILIFIKGWTDRKVITDKDITDRWNDVSEKILSDKADSIYDKFILNILADRRIVFNIDTFNKLTKILAPYYINTKQQAKDEFLDLAYKDDIERPDVKSFSSEYDEIKNENLLTIESNSSTDNWTVEEFKRQFDKHPLVFRKDAANKKFAERLRLAIVDLVRDKFLTDVAYTRGYDRNEIVNHYTEQWKDATVAFVYKQKYLQQFDLSGKKELEIIQKYLNPHYETLVKKYSSQIEINVDEFNQYQPTRIDMFTSQDNVPYQVYVPAFPQITNYNKLDFGKRWKE